VVECFDEEAAGAGCGIEHSFAEAWIGDRAMNRDDRTRSVDSPESPAASRISPEHGFVERAERVEFVVEVK